MHNHTLQSAEGKGHSFLPSLEEIQKLNDIEQIEILLRDTKQREITINEELDEAVRASEKVESHLELFEVIPVRFQTIYKESKTLEHTINVACKIAETVSKKVRDLDTVRARLKETTKKVTDIIDVKNCLEGVKKSMETEDYEAAAAHIQRYLNIDASVLEENSLKQLKEAEQKLKDIFNKKLDEAIKSNNEKEIVRFCWLYTPLGLRDEGLTRYSHYLRNLCSIEAESLHKLLLRSLGRSYNAQPEDEKPVTVTETTTKLFEFIAAMIEDQTPIVNEKFGPGSMVTVIKNLQMQSDVHATKILDLFFEHYHIQRTVDDVTNYKKRAMEAYGSNVVIQQIDPRQLSFILDEIVTISQSAELYDRFIRSKSKAAMEMIKPETSSAESPKETVVSNTTIKKKPADGLLHVSELNRKMQELIGHYILLEEYYMDESVYKAVKMDEPLEDSPTSSIVDHVFFVLQQCSHRALLSTNVNAICAIVNILVNVLTKDYLDVLQRTIQEQISRSLISTASLLRSNTVEYKVNVNTMLNNLEVSSEYIVKLKKEMETECQDRIFGSLDVKLKSCFDEMQESTNSFKRVLQGFLETISNSLIPKLKPALDSFALVAYELTEVEFSDREINDPFVQQFIHLIDSLLSPYKQSLTSSNYDNLVHLILKYVVQKLEADLLRKKFNQLGGLQLDKEIRVLQNYFSSLTQKTVRDKFARLTQMAALLYLEKVKEAEEYWGQNSTYMTWRLTPGEVRRVLGLRVDFSKDSIAKLKLN